jgi:hypothetical protein
VYNPLTCKFFASHFPCSVLRQQRNGVLRDHQLLVSRHRRTTRLSGREISDLPSALAAGSRTTPSHASFSAMRARIVGEFSPMPAVNTKASPAQCRCQHPGVQPDAVDKIIDGECRARIRTRLEISHVIADAGQGPFKTAVTIHV